MSFKTLLRKFEVSSGSGKKVEDINDNGFDLNTKLLNFEEV